MSKSTSRMFRRDLRNGFSLIELMIAIFITLFLIGGMAVIIMSMRGSFITQDQLGKTHENQLFALTVFDTTARQTGYFVNPAVNTAILTFPAQSSSNTDGTAFGALQTISGTSSGSGDTLNVRYQTASGDGLMNCNGDVNTSGGPIVWTNSFSVNTTNQLMCAVRADNNAAGQPSVLIDGVSSIAVLAGISSVGGNSVDMFVPVGSLSPTTKVLSVSLQIKFIDLVNSKTNTIINLPPLSHVINLMNSR